MSSWYEFHFLMVILTTFQMDCWWNAAVEHQGLITLDVHNHVWITFCSHWSCSSNRTRENGLCHAFYRQYNSLYTGSDLFWHCYRWATLLKSGFFESRLAKLQLSMKHSVELARHQRASRTWKSCLERIRMYEEGNVVRCQNISHVIKTRSWLILKSFSSN